MYDLAEAQAHEGSKRNAQRLTGCAALWYTFDALTMVTLRA
jgi:hypothetical protein